MKAKLNRPDLSACVIERNPEMQLIDKSFNSVMVDLNCSCNYDAHFHIEVGSTVGGDENLVRK